MRWRSFLSMKWWTLRRTRGYNQTDTSTIELQYTQNNTIVPDSDGRTIDRIKCFKCLKYGHYFDFCPNMITGEQIVHDATIIDISQDLEDEIVNLNSKSANKSEEDLNNTEIVDEIIQDKSDDDSLVVNFHFLQKDRAQHLLKQGKLKGNDILLNTGSTCSIFCDNNLLRNIRKSTNTLRALTNGGYQDLYLIEHSLVSSQYGSTINQCLIFFSFAKVHKVYRITIDTDIATTINVHLHNGNIMTFTEVDSGLYIFQDNT